MNECIVKAAKKCALNAERHSSISADTDGMTDNKEMPTQCEAMAVVSNNAHGLTEYQRR